jgi:hypothetical protein
MIQKNRPVCDPAKQVEPEIAAFFREGCIDFHGRGFDVMFSRAIRQQHWGKPRRRPTLSQRSIMTIPVGKMYHPGPGITDQIPERRL